MKIIKTEDGFINEATGEQVTWRNINDLTGLEKKDARLLLKKLAASGKDVPEQGLLRWRDDMVLMWKLEHEMGVTLPSSA
jgi:hypothetical protein